jgi:hypothetical protein
VTGLVVAIVAMVSLVVAVTEYQGLAITGSEPPSSSAAASTPSGGTLPIGMTGGCQAFRANAQNRFDPVGASIRVAPTPTAATIRTVAPNYQLFLDGFVYGDVAYPLNTPPWNSNIWFHVADGGWVSFAGVRAVPTSFDPTGHADGGPPVPLLDACRGALQ